MTHITWKEDRRPIELEVDVVVVGSGAGGSVCAVHLARAGWKVAVVEAGAWRDPEDYPSSMFGALRDLYDNFGASIVRGRGLWPVVQGRTVGGTTVINSAIVVRTPQDIFEEWQRDHGFGGDWAERIWRFQDELEDELKVQKVPDQSQGRSNELAIVGAKSLGIHDHDMLRNVDACEGTGFCGQGCKRGRKQSTNLNYIPETKNRGGVILSCAPVDKILFDKNRAIGVTGRLEHPVSKRRGATFTVRANRAVVVAASATHSPALLLRSKIKSKALGYYFRAHPGTSIFGSYDQPVHMNRGATQGWGSTAHRGSHGLKYETLTLAPELVASRLGGVGVELMERLAEHPHLAMWVLAIRAKAAGRVTLGWGGKPSISYSVDKNDMEALRYGAHTIAQMHVAAGARWIIPGIHGLPYRLAPDQIDQILEAPLDPRCWVAILSHLFGGCVMGEDPERSVCDSRGQVRGYENLVVADASSIPTTLGVNPQHTIMALARLRAEELLEERPIRAD